MVLHARIESIEWMERNTQPSGSHHVLYRGCHWFGSYLFCIFGQWKLVNISVYQSSLCNFFFGDGSGDTWLPVWLKVATISLLLCNSCVYLEISCAGTILLYSCSYAQRKPKSFKRGTNRAPQQPMSLVSSRYCWISNLFILYCSPSLASWMPLMFDCNIANGIQNKRTVSILVHKAVPLFYKMTWRSSTRLNILLLLLNLW